jgi:integrase
MPTVKFNAAWIKFVTATTTQVDYFDKSLTGFFLRVSPQGRKSFGIMYRHAGRLRRMTFGTFPPMTLKDARKEANQKLRQAANGEDPATERAQQRKADTFQEMALEYVERHAKARKKSWPEDERRINKHLIPIFGNCKAKEITRRDIRPVLEGMALKTPIEANRVRSLLRKIYNWAILNEIVDANPVTLIPAPGEEKRRQRVLTEDEIKGLWKVLDGQANGMKAQRKVRMLAAGSLKLRLLTAQRGGEVMGMRWNEVDSDWWTIPPERSKNGLAHRVPLTPLAIRLLEEMKKLYETTPADFVFPGPRGGHIENVQKTIQRVRRGAGFHFVGHDLRRTAASLMTGMGIPRLTVSKILNHVEPGVTAVYDRYSYDKEKREALEAWSKRLLVMVSDLKGLQKEAN